MKKSMYYSFGGLLFIFIFLSIVQFYGFNASFYFHEYDKNNIYKNIAYKEQDIKNITYNIINYLQDKDKSLYYKQVFGNKEIKHMKDVKNLFQIGLKIKNLSLGCIFIILMIYLKNYKDLLYFLNRSLRLINLIFLSICALVALNYDASFTLFHKIFFNNDLWLLEPKENIIINLLPLNFFMDITLYIFITNLILNILFIGVLTYVNKILKRKVKA